MPKEESHMSRQLAKVMLMGIAATAAMSAGYAFAPVFNVAWHFLTSPQMRELGGDEMSTMPIAAVVMIITLSLRRPINRIYNAITR